MYGINYLLVMCVLVMSKRVISVGFYVVETTFVSNVC